MSHALYWLTARFFVSRTCTLSKRHILYSTDSHKNYRACSGSMAATARNLNKGSRGNGNVALVLSDDILEKPQQLVVGEW